MAEYRGLRRFEIALPLNMRLLASFRRPLIVDVQTRNVSLEGLSIELYGGGESSRLIPHLVLDRQAVALEIAVPRKGEGIRAIGRVMWYDSGSRRRAEDFRAGIFLEEMEAEDRKVWAEFVLDTERLWSIIRS